MKNILLLIFCLALFGCFNMGSNESRKTESSDKGRRDTVERLDSSMEQTKSTPIVGHITSGDNSPVTIKVPEKLPDDEMRKAESKGLKENTEHQSKSKSEYEIKSIWTLVIVGGFLLVVFFIVRWIVNKFHLEKLIGHKGGQSIICDMRKDTNDSAEDAVLAKIEAKMNERSARLERKVRGKSRP